MYLFSSSSGCFEKKWKIQTHFPWQSKVMLKIWTISSAKQAHLKSNSSLASLHAVYSCAENDIFLLTADSIKSDLKSYLSLIYWACKKWPRKGIATNIENWFWVAGSSITCKQQSRYLQLSPCESFLSC